MSFIGKPTNYLNFGAVKINKYPKLAPCGNNPLYCQPTTVNDDIAFQFEASESEELLTNGDFNSGSASWNPYGWAVEGVTSPSDANKHACKVNVLNGMYQSGVLTLNEYYKITLTVSNMTMGNVQAGAGTGITLINNALIASGNGTFTAYFTVTGGGTDFTIVGSSDFDGCVDDVSAIKISDTSDYTVQIHDHDTGALIDTVPSANMRISENIITVDFNWTDDVSVTNGCRVLRIFDSTNIFEDNFATDQGWTLDTDVTISGGTMNYLSTGSNRAALIGGIFTPGESYTITYDVTMTGTGTSQVKAGKTSGTQRNANGTYAETLTATHSTNLIFAFTGAAASTVTIDNITIKKEDNLDGQSECYDLQTTHDCTVLLEWWNNESWGGYDYTQPSTGDAFVHRLRIVARFRGGIYPSIADIGEDSAGVKTLDYTSIRKKRILDIDFAPDYIHDGIAAMFMQDNRLIDNVSYILDEEYEASTPSDSKVLFKDMMTARIEIEETTQSKLINRT